MKRLLPLLLLPAVAHADVTGSIEGTLIESTTQKVLAGRVDLTCGKVKKSARADATGHFVVSGLPEGPCTLTAAGDFVTVTINVNVTASSISAVLVNVMSRAQAEKIRKDEERARAEQAKWMKKNRVMVRGAGRGAVGGAPGAVFEGDFAAGIDAAPPPAMAPPPPPPKPAMKAPVVVKPAPQNKPAEAPRVDAKTAPMAPAATVQAGPMANANGSTTPAKIVVLDGDLKKQQQEQAIRREQARRNKADRQIANRVAMQNNNNGWALVRVFPVPESPKNYDGPRTDFRETIYWNPTVETNGNGVADVTFTASDAVTSFRATAEGFSANGLPGAGQVAFQSKLPLTLDAHLPVEVTSGDTVKLPVTITNETAEPIDAALTTKFGSAFKLAGTAPARVKVAAKSKETLVFELAVGAMTGTGDVDLEIASKGLVDSVHKQIKVVPKGFPIEVAASGTAKKGSSKNEIDLSGAMPGSIRASVTMYPSPVAAIASGMDGMIREPGGCFEQASSTNYPNIMILGYLESTSTGADPALLAKTKGVLDKGYKILSGYETKEKGYEWFGNTPGHEALTAYGLMEFADMGKVYDVDKKMVERTADWLMTRRDGQGGFQRSAQALDSFGRANPTTTNAYIMWALSEAKRTGSLQKEVNAQKTLGGETKDPYLLALATNTAWLSAPKSADASSMAKRLAGMQAKDGSFSGAKETITMSGGESLTIETTALATLALLKASPNSEYEVQIRSAVEWLNGKRGGYGAWGNTQATILGLKALTAYAEHSRQMATGGTATLVINGKDAGSIKFEKGRRDALVWNDIAGKLGPGKNTVEVRLDSAATLPYTISVDFRSTQPPTSPKSKVAVSTELLKTQAKMGDGVTLRAHVENKTKEGIPMTLARIGLPGGTVFQTWQLKELRDKGLIDFYETRPREVILYWRAMAPGAKKDVDINLLAAVPGTFEAPASSTYLYYTAEDKSWSKPVGITIEK